MEKRMEKMQLDDDGLVAVMGEHSDRVITMIQLYSLTVIQLTSLRVKEITNQYMERKYLVPELAP